MKAEEQPKQIEAFWTSLYRARSNDIEEVWNLEKQNQYKQQYESKKERVREYMRVEEDENWTEWKVNPNLREHLDMAGQCRKMGIQPMNDNDIHTTTQEIRNQLQKTKIKKAMDPME